MIIDHLYAIFHRDFVAQRTELAGSVYVDPRSHKKEDDKECDFWHLTTRTESEPVWVGNKRVWQVIGRYPDFRRAERLEWVRQIITNHAHENIKLFYHRENNQKHDIRLYLWAYDSDFVVILQKLGRSSSFMVTSFFVDHEDKKLGYETRYQNYIAGNPDLRGCEWF
jgi:hypothetical protein